RKISELGGLAQKSPSMAILLVTVALANIALPLTNAFAGEFLMFNGIFSSITQYNVWFTVLAGMGVIFGAVYMLNMIRKVFYGEINGAVVAVTPVAKTEVVALGVIVIVIFWLGVYPHIALSQTMDSTQTVLQKMEPVFQSLRK